VNSLEAASVRAVFLFAIAALCANAAQADELRAAMAKVEALLLERGIVVEGYGRTAPPEVSEVDRAHVFLQGNAGAYIDGRIYLSDAQPADCKPVTLIHELVHDATVKYRLFASVPNARVKMMLEALADDVTAAAAQSPYRPGCLPARTHAVPMADLALLAMRPELRAAQ
jgi:hypothetical protein